MATKKRAAKKRVAKKRVVRKASPKGRAKARTLKVQDLKSATAASVRALVGKALPRLPGVLAGILISEEALAKLKKSPATLASLITKQVSAASGLTLRPGTVRGPGGILVGYVQPNIRVAALE
jgi:hypothetical protein